MMSWKASERLMDTIRHYAKFPATGVSLRQMVQFGEKPSVGMFSSPRAVSGLFLTDRLRYSVSGFSIPRRRTPNSPGTSRPRIGRAPRWPQRDAIRDQGQGLVCSVVRGMAHSPSSPTADGVTNRARRLF